MIYIYRGVAFVITLFSPDNSINYTNMNGLIIALFATLAVSCASPSGLGLGLGLGVVGPRAVIVPPSSATIISRPLGLGLGLGLGPVVGPWGVGPVVGPLGVPLAGPLVAPLAAPLVAPAGAVAITNGGGVVEASAHGAVVAGPKTAPVIIDGPSGTVKASGLWGPTLAGVLH
ncbi:uncharacterized protein LOC126889274 [Diabrotica virgifera virgifera]|nr:uncharacterized protein LOC126889274 [Diabrotica virgifera virgifera]